ncbi:MAG: 3'(2'),5'-bisphosphate nucleotidase CysQ family protein, partial [Alphaproteobacteria bacterium]
MNHAQHRDAADGGALIDALNAAAIAAGAVILDVRRRGHTVETKYDASPVTEADRAAEALIMDRLAVATPDIPVVAEEAVYGGMTPETDERFYLVDPLDGTREFVRGGDDFTVNIGLVEDGVPMLGVIFVPATG